MSTSKHAYQGFFQDDASGTVAHGSGLGLTSPASSTGGCTPTAKYEDKDPFTSPDAKLGPEQKLSATASSFQPFGVRLNQGPTHSLTGGSQYVEPVSPTDSFASGIGQQGIFSTDTQVTRALRISGIYITVSREQVETCLQEKGIPERATRRFYHTANEVLVRFSDVQDAVIIYNYAKISHPEWSVEYITPGVCAEKANPNSAFVSAYEGQVSLTAKLPGVGGFDRAKIEDIIVDLLAIDGAVYAYQKQAPTEAGAVGMIVEFCDVGSAHRAVARLNGATVRGITLKLGLHKPDIDQRPPRVPHGSQHTPIRGRGDYDDLIGSIERLSISSPPAYNQQVPFSYPTTMMSPVGSSYVPTFPVNPVFPATVPLGGPYLSAQSPVTGYTPGGYGIPSQYGATSVTSDNSRLTTPTGKTWNNTGSPMNGGSSKDESQSQLRLYGRRQNSVRQSAVRGTGRPPFGSSVGQHNIVDVGRIRQGLDVRTTIMLRNIPNKIDQQMLKGIIDETSFGSYDFMYLRIDFANNCNVGYAFINFEDPWHIIAFVEARAGQRWNRYNSDKVAEVSYATIQGKDCLVQKFRNSSVMLEHPSFRPKIFRTGPPHLGGGEEEDFPLPDNASKMRRSVENAEHVGLFAPRAGQHHRDEQRRRRSQYDRGTRLAALEEFEFEDVISYQDVARYSY
ncbi:hypothetical protein VC83_00536 [Pseudogymnoascus destructans]|uniref:RRM domain-containing protein n=2 Tax=Pseudogymnoascus destructans TaxID=655981 RepID=L8GE61_PSED2|nr:uncharacterized protein VC83_00536 [Pseudogymnoascus destructans]ELR10446.1 hypothetical protein GMDG_00858 [Pseudogymnoascus destructans 20631-21]OAF62975.2 hypothetical protein VC83_00536 [Pseudogymnoascus destructans]